MGAMTNSDTPDTNIAAGGGADSATPETAPTSDDTSAAAPRADADSGRVPDFGKGALPYGRPMQTEFDDGLEYPRIGGVSFRRGTLTPGQSAIWDEPWDRVGTVLSDDMIDVDEWFGRTGPTIVEIGCGTGTSTVAMAPEEADRNIIAVELYKPGLAKLLSAMTREGVDNIRMVRGDGVEVLQRMIAPESLDGVRLFFPDPWPKARHHKRRILQTGTLRLIASRLVPGGVWRLATDWAEYAEQMLEVLDAEPLLEGGRVERWDERPVTKFERKGIAKGREITDLMYRRVI